MRMAEAIAKADELRMNSLSDEQKSKWLFELDCAVAEMMGSDEPVWDFPCDSERELLMPERYEDVYVKYLVAMIDYYNGESELYSNDISIYNQAMKEAGAWLIRRNRPASAGSWRI